MLKIVAQSRGLALVFKRGFAIQQFRLPDLGEKIKEATIKKWRVKEGDLVDEFDTVAEVATDKLFTEIPSPYKGKIHRLMYKEDDACNVGDVLLEIDTPEQKDKQTDVAVNVERVDGHVTRKEAKETKREMDEKKEENGEKGGKQTKVLASPAVRALAKELNVRLEDIEIRNGSDKVTKEDVHRFADNLKKSDKIEQKHAFKEDHKIKRQEEQRPSKVERSVDKPDRKRHEGTQNVQTPVKMKLFEQGMVKSMNNAVTVPHFNLHDEYDITELDGLRQKLKAQGQSATLFSFIVKAFSLAIDSVPRMNSSYYPDKNPYECHVNSAHNISIAIDSPQGLAAPNIKNVEGLSVVEINKQIKELQRVTSEGRLTASHLEGGTIALSNIGTITGHFASPLNLPSQVCIVALGKLTTKPVFNENTKSFEPRKVLPVSFGCDHRVLDGATVARFSVAWKNLMENPGLMLAQLR